MCVCATTTLESMIAEAILLPVNIWQTLELRFTSKGVRFPNWARSEPVTMIASSVSYSNKIFCAKMGHGRDDQALSQNER